MSVINRDLAEKYDLSHPAFQGHSKSLEVPWINRLPISDPQ